MADIHTAVTLNRPDRSSRVQSAQYYRDQANAARLSVPKRPQRPEPVGPSWLLVSAGEAIGAVTVACAVGFLAALSLGVLG